MTRLLIGAVLGVAVGLVAGAALGIHADGPTEEEQALAAEANVDVHDAVAAVATVSEARGEPVALRAYLEDAGHLERPRPPMPRLNAALEARLDCIQRFESRGDAGATNPRSKAAGLFQFLWSTWATTPQGRAGLSPYDPVAARSAARWMVGQGRAREWVPVQLGWC